MPMTLEEAQTKIKELEETNKEAKTKVDEFRENNIKLQKTVDEVNKKLEGIDLDEYKKLQKNAEKLKAEQQKLKDKELIEAGDVAKLLDEKVKNIREEFAKKTQETENANQLLKTQLESELVENAVKSKAIEAGVNPTAIDDVILRSKGIWKVKDGKPVAVDKDGNTVYGKGTNEALTLEKWVTGLNETAPHLFNSSKGTNSTVTNPAVGAKTITREQFNQIDDKSRAEFFKDGGQIAS